MKRFSLANAFLARFCALICIFTLLAAGCTFIPTNKTPTPELQKTIDAQALQMTQQSLANTQTAMAVPPTLPPTIPPPPLVQPQATGGLIVDPVQVQVDTPENPGSLDERMKSAQILLYEDMVGQPKVRRYVKETLENMRLPYEDVGSAVGRLKERLTLGNASGQPYDLIIIASEDRFGPMVTGEYFQYLLDNMEHNTAVIIEGWFLNRISEGQAKPLLDKCGVKITNYTGSIGSEMDMVLWPTGTSHPMLTEPNNYPKLTKPIFFWKPIDLGDFMALSGSGDAQLLIGRKSGESQKYGLVAVCMGGQLTLQTFSSHTYYLEVM